MYKLLIVDDEPFIVEGLKNLFENDEKYTFDIYTARNGDNALLVLESIRIDLVITDIRMFGINGIELSKKIKEKWPSCKVIILSGYNKPDYLLDAINSGIDSYILKCDYNSKLTEAVHSCINAIEQENSRDMLQTLAKKCIDEAMPIIKNNFLDNLVKGLISHEEIIKKINQLNISLSFNRDILMVGAKIDSEISSDIDAATAINSVFVRNISLRANIEFINLNSQYLFWIVQSKDKSIKNEEFFIYVGNNLDLVQQQCFDSFSISISILCGNGMIIWDEIPLSYRRIKKLLTYQLSVNDKMVIANEQFLDSNLVFETSVRSTLKEAQFFLEHGKESDFVGCIDKLISLMNFKKKDLLFNQIYSGIIYTVLNYIENSNKADEFNSIYKDCDIFFSVAENSIEFRETIFGISNWIFKEIKSTTNKREAELIYTLHKYIENNIANDLSLLTLSKTVYLNPVYLSRLYKQITGTNLSEYILVKRIDYSKNLMKDPLLKISSIANMSGFESAAHFTRTFKKIVGTTPQDFRNNS